MDSNTGQCSACSSAGAISGLIPCSQCSETGKEWGRVACASCAGSGTHNDNDNSTRIRLIPPSCSTCNGTGSYTGLLPCSTCNGIKSYTSKAPCSTCHQTAPGRRPSNSSYVCTSPQLVFRLLTLSAHSSRSTARQISPPGEMPPAGDIPAGEMSPPEEIIESRRQHGFALNM